MSTDKLKEHYFVVKATITEQGEIDFDLDDDTLTARFSGTVWDGDEWTVPSHDTPDYDKDQVILSELRHLLRKRVLTK